MAILLSLGVGAVWFAQGMHMGTLTKKLIEVEKTDEFGDKVVERSWEKTFELGLDFAGPGGGALFGLGAVLLVADRRRRRKA